MSDSNKSVKDAKVLVDQPADWLVVQTAIAARNLKNRPIERRGPYVISDEDLNDKFNLK